MATGRSLAETPEKTTATKNSHGAAHGRKDDEGSDSDSDYDPKSDPDYNSEESESDFDDDSDHDYVMVSAGPEEAVLLFLSTRLKKKNH